VGGDGCEISAGRSEIIITMGRVDDKSASDGSPESGYPSRRSAWLTFGTEVLAGGRYLSLRWSGRDGWTGNGERLVGLGERRGRSRRWIGMKPNACRVDGIVDEKTWDGGGGCGEGSMMRTRREATGREDAYLGMVRPWREAPGGRGSRVWIDIDLPVCPHFTSVLCLSTERAWVRVPVLTLPRNSFGWDLLPFSAVSAATPNNGDCSDRPGCPRSSTAARPSIAGGQTTLQTTPPTDRYYTPQPIVVWRNPLSRSRRDPRHPPVAYLPTPLQPTLLPPPKPAELPHPFPRMALTLPA